MWYNFRKKIPKDPYFLLGADLLGLACIRITPDLAGVPRWLVTKKRTGLEPGDVNMIGKRTDGNGLALPATNVK